MFKLDSHKIAQLLTTSSNQLDSNTLLELQKIRRQALSQQAAYSRFLAWAAHLRTHNYDLIPRSTQSWVVTGVLAILIIAGFEYLPHTQEAPPYSVDLAILTDELPINVFVD